MNLLEKKIPASYIAVEKAVATIAESLKNEMPVLEESSLSEITEGYIDIVSYMAKYYPINSMDRKEFWKNVFRLGKDEGRKEEWRGALLILEICLCAPHSNAALERFFSLLKYVKSNLRCSLGAEILNALMRIKISGPSLEEFSSKHCKTCVTQWYTAKNRRTHQTKRKSRKQQHPANPTSSSSSDDSDDEYDDDEDME